MDDEALAAALAVARSAEQLPGWRPSDWPDLAVELLLAGIDDLEIAELAGLPASVTGWETGPLVASLCQKHGVPPPDPDEAVTLLARLMAADLRLRPATVTAPMIRVVAGLALEAAESDLANQCLRSVEFLDCDCVPVDRRLEAELEAEHENLTPLALPDSLIQVLARPLRRTLPLSQPPHGHCPSGRNKQRARAAEERAAQRERPTCHAGSVRRRMTPCLPSAFRKRALAGCNGWVDEQLRRELLSRCDEDQRVRQLVSPPKGRHMTRLPDEVAAEWQRVDADNTRWLGELLAVRGWPGRTLVGEEGAQAAWLLAQHADHDPDLQRAFLDALRTAVAQGEASPAQLAYLEDRVRVHAGQPQLYGTQFTVTGDEFGPFPIEDPQRLDERRAEAGLEPFAAYEARMRTEP